MLGQCAVADLVVCASEKQRDLWLGGLGLAGLLDPERYEADPTFRSFVDVVPFGLPDRPRRARRAGPEGRLAGDWRGRQRADLGRRCLALARRAHPDPGGRAAAARRGARSTSSSWGRAGRRATRQACPRARTRRSPSRAGSAWRASGCTSTGAGSRMRSARRTCPMRTSACARTTTTWRPASRSAPACSTTSGPGCPRSCRAATRSASWWTAAGSDARSHRATPRASRQRSPSYSTIRPHTRRQPAVCASSRPRCAGPSARARWCASAWSTTTPPRRPPRGALARATYGQYPDVLAALREHGGPGEAARALPRHLARLLRHRA